MQCDSKKLVLTGIVILSFMLPLQNGWVKGEVRNLDENFYDHQIIYVGSLGKESFSSIQDAINNASSGDTIYVHSGIYYENIFIGKKVALIGEHPLTTIIDGSEGVAGYRTDVIEVAADEVAISDFTLRNSVGNGAGIDIWTRYGYERITNCILYNNYYGVSFYKSQSNYITNCTFYNNEYGFWQECCCGYTCPNSLFYRNNFTNNAIQAFDKGTSRWYNEITGNYWSDYTGRDDNGDGIGDEPYNISGGANKDYYPLIGPIDVIPPVVKIVFPGGGETLAGDITIKWSVSDDCDPNPKIDIEYSNDGSTWHMIAKGLDNSGEYKWDTMSMSLPIGINYSIKVTAIDGSGNKRSDVSDYPFIIIYPPTIEVIRPLQGYIYIRNRELIRLPKNTTICIGNMNIGINAFSEIGIEKVEFYVDDTLVDTTIDEPYEWEWESAFGKHGLKIIAYDKAENTNATAMEVWKFF